MAKYKRADLAEEEDSVHVNDGDNNHLKTHVLPIQPLGIWKARTSLEKVLLTFSFVAFLALSVSFVCMLKGYRGWYNLLHSTQDGQVCLTPTCVKIASTMLTSMDLTADPCEDFYQYACGGWVRSNPIPEGKSNWGTFQKLWQENQLVIKQALEKEGNHSTGEQKAKWYYHSCLDKNEIQEKLGSEPMIQFLAKIGGWSITPGTGYSLDKFDFQDKLNLLHNEYNMGSLFSWAVGEDDRNSTKHVIQIDQGGLTLPTRDYYLNSTHAHVMEAYLKYMTRVAMLLGANNDTTTIEAIRNVIEFEKELANITVPSEERRDDEKLYHAKNISELQLLAPVISWKQYFTNAFSKVAHEIKDEHVVVIYAPEYLEKMSHLIETKLNTTEGKTVVNDYLVWHMVKTLTSCLSKAFREAEKILRKAILGSDGTEETWRTCVTDVNNNLGFAVGAMFIRETFHSDSKPLAQEMIEEIRTAFQRNLWNLKWMDDETRNLAREKAGAITDMIGYPDFILIPDQLDKKYTKLVINETDYFGNNIRVSQFSLLQNLEKLSQPVNRTKWGMTPPTVNAYYTPTSNQMVIPAGILQWPFFDPQFPKSVNFGAMGVVMGHELTHAFDDQGREYDKDGNLNQWWQNDTVERFKAQTECVVKQYSSYKIDGENVNGNTTIGENIADNGGLKASFHAYKQYSSEWDLPLPGLNLTQDQIFFLSFAQVWCSSSLKETLILQLQNDPHVPAPLRVRGPVSNLPEFATTYRCSVGSQMNPVKKCTVW